MTGKYKAYFYVFALILNLSLTGCFEGFKPTTDSSRPDQRSGSDSDDTTPPTGLVQSVSASGSDGNIPENTIDYNLNTRWSADGVEQWIQFDLGSSKSINAVSIAWYRGDSRQSYFDIEISENQSVWTTLLTDGSSSGSSLELEEYGFAPGTGRYLRIIGKGNSENDWISITEVRIFEGTDSPDPSPTSTTSTTTTTTTTTSTTTTLPAPTTTTSTTTTTLPDQIVFYSGFELPGHNDFQIDFNKDAGNGWSTSNLGCEHYLGRPGGCDHSGELVSSPSRRGNRAMRIQLNREDQCRNSKRAEIVNSLDKDPLKTMNWYALSIFAPLDYEADNTLELHTQWHASPDNATVCPDNPEDPSRGEVSRSPPLQLLADGDEWYFSNRWNTQRCQYSNSSEGSVSSERFPIGRGVWTDFVIQARWSWESDGYLRIWRNGEVILERNGPNAYNDNVNKGLYWSFGVYKWPWRNEEADNYGGSQVRTRVLYYDDIRKGDEFATYEDMAP